MRPGAAQTGGISGVTWRQEIHRSVLQRGEIDIGAIYPPSRGGTLWKWHIWVTMKGRPISGRVPSEAQARSHVERRFQAFLDAARLIPAGGDA
jgi:hypothetical protein